jgi:uncharacterized protein (DUF302 family)
MNVVHTRTADGTVDDVGRRLEGAVKAHQFGVIGVIDLQAKMREKGVEFGRQCRIYEICNPQMAKAVLERDMSIATALPCRIAVYEEAGHVTLATLLPTETLGMFQIPGLTAEAQQVETAILAMIDAAAR